MDNKLLVGRSVQNKRQREQTELYYGIAESNIEDIFTYNFDSNDNDLYGAKAVAVENFRKEIDICFFAQGKARVGNNVHHRDVYANMIGASLETKEFKSYEKFLKVIAEIQPLEGAELSEASKIIFAPGEVDQNTICMFVTQVLKSGLWEDIFVPLLEVRERFEELASLIKQRSNERLEEYQMFDAVFSAQGYQFSARRRKSGMIIVNAQMDSSLTSIHKRFSSKSRFELYQRMNTAVLEKIDSAVRGFTEIVTPENLRPISDENL